MTFRRGTTQVEGRADIVAHDFASTANVFFGDRPLDNPGYSAFSLADEVKVGSKNVLDVYRVEQRLKYLGFPAMGTGNPTASNNTIQDFKVDGSFTEKEVAALKLFEKVVRYGNGEVSGNFTGSVDDASATAKVVLRISATGTGTSTKGATIVSQNIEVIEAFATAKGLNATDPTKAEVEAKALEKAYAKAYDAAIQMSFPRFFVCQRAVFMLPVFPDVAC